MGRCHTRCYRCCGVLRGVPSELSLSVDNIFVFLIVFAELHIPPEHQRRVLAWGVAGALVFRAVMITAGIALIQRVEWIMYPFGALILFAAWRMLFADQRERRVVAGACDVCSTWIARVVRVSPVLDGHQFWRREGGRLVATPLFVALAVIETTDIVFALDSVPAVLAITQNPLIVYSSNGLAMFGLRSLSSWCLTRSTGCGTCGTDSPPCSCLLARK